MSPAALVAALPAALTVELLRQPYRARVEGGAHPATGHCYVACEALYSLLGGKAAGWTPMCQQHEGGPHWWLRGPSGEVVDPTAAQFSTPVPYQLGKGKGFLTAQPSRRARIVIERLQIAGLGG
jgi:hypothetical protein